MIKIPGTGGGFGANGSDGGVDGTFGVELILKCIMCITSKVFYETMINDERFSLFCGVIWRPSLKRKKERKRNFVFFGRKRYFFFKSEKRLLTDGQKGDKKKSRKREKHRNR